VKTVKFKNPSYVGDPINAVKIFNDKEVDELIFLDIEATPQKRDPDYKMIANIAGECFMPFSYGGGIHTITQVKELFTLGVEKVTLNSVLFSDPGLVKEIADIYGSQAVIASIDVKKNFWGTYEVMSHGGSKSHKKDPVEWARELEVLGVGEILLTSVDQEGTWEGFNCELIKKVSNAVNIPVIAHGGCGSMDHIEKAFKECNVSAVGLGSMVVYQKKGLGVLINMPERKSLEKFIYS